MRVVLGAVDLRRQSKRKYVQIWAESLRRFNPSMRIVVFETCSSDEASLATILKPADIETVRLAPRLSPMPIALTRNLSYRDWLRRHLEVTEAICLDMFDVVCQGDLAGIDLSRGMWMTQENVVVGDCPFNRAWIAHGYGMEWLETLEDTPVICCGAFGGIRSELMLYLETYAEELAVRQADDVAGFDQSSLNVWASRDEDATSLVLPYRNTQCVHMGYAPASDFSCDAEGIWMEGRTVKPLLLHQWNRTQHAPMERYLRETYPFHG